MCESPRFPKSRRRGRYHVFLALLPPDYRPSAPGDVPESFGRASVEGRNLTLQQAVMAARDANAAALQANPDPSLWSIVVIGPKRPKAKGGAA